MYPLQHRRVSIVPQLALAACKATIAPNIAMIACHQEIEYLLVHHFDTCAVHHGGERVGCIGLQKQTSAVTVDRLPISILGRSASQMNSYYCDVTNDRYYDNHVTPAAGPDYSLAS